MEKAVEVWNIKWVCVCQYMYAVQKKVLFHTKTLDATFNSNMHTGIRRLLATRNLHFYSQGNVPTVVACASFCGPGQLVKWGGGGGGGGDAPLLLRCSAISTEIPLIQMNIAI